MLDFTSTANDLLTHGLCCAALNPSLGSVLVFDLQPDCAHSVADTFAGLIAAATGERVEQAWLNSAESEDRLWGGFAFSDRDTQAPLSWQPGLLSPTADSDAIRLIVIPDLERIGLSVARALVTMVGAEVAHLERYGKEHQWLPKFYWLGGCTSAAASRISLHLLDRFALRLHAPAQPRPDSADLLAWLNLSDGNKPAAESFLTESLLQRLREARLAWPRMTELALARVLEYEAASEPRRSFALARVGHTLGRLFALPTVSDKQIDSAARLIGLPVPHPVRQTEHIPNDSAANVLVTADSSAERADDFNEVEVSKPDEPSVQASPLAKLPSNEAEVSKPDEPSVQASPLAELPSAALTTPFHPYPEDCLTTEREAASLRLPFLHSRQTSATRGTIIGTQPTRTLHDLALVSTLFESAKFQQLRRHPATKSGAATNAKWIIRASDLRSYRRAPVQEQLLMLMLDYTCLGERPWLKALLPYFKQAYVDRARICLVQVGVATAGHWLRADRRLFNNVLVPGLAAALDAPVGQATPLAHGLEMALQTLRHSLQHGRQLVHAARLIVLSDGRGNVPLADSVAGKVMRPVGRQGIEDALLVARKLRVLDRVEIVLLDPQPVTHRGLVTTLAEELGAITHSIPLGETAEAKP